MQATSRRIALPLIAAAALGFLTVDAWGADGPAAPAGIPTITRLVRTFLELENVLLADIRGGHADGVRKMLTDDFEMRVGSAPGTPTPRENWLTESLAKPDTGGIIEQMSVHDYANVAVVSFLLAGNAGGKRDRARDIFIVDVWTNANGPWKLTTRYASPAGAPEFVIPGASRTPPVVNKRY